MNEYQLEQIKALQMVRQHINAGQDLSDRGQISNQPPPRARGQNFILSPKIKNELRRYHDFRSRTARFHRAHFEQICTEKCYFSNLSACCSKGGIIVFFADVVINVLASSAAGLDLLEHTIANPISPRKCIFLIQNGCLWRIKPIVCEMFVCRTAKSAAFGDDPEAARQWEEFEKERKTFTWPDQPVLFEHLERLFIDMGAESSLMHLHKSPGLLCIRKNRETSSG